MEGILYNYKSYKAEIKNLALEIEELSNDYTGCSSITFEEHSTPTNKFNSNVENEVINKDIKIKQLEKRKRQKEIQIEKIDNVIEALPQDEAKLIRLRYFDRLNFKIIGQRLCMNSDYLVTKKSEIIMKMAKLIFLSETY